jgi:hypothetical protein
VNDQQPDAAACASDAGVDYQWINWPMPPNFPTAYTLGADALTGTVRDDVTGLVWQQMAPAQSYSWSDAVSYCSTLTLAGGGWRLPTVIELVSIVDYERVSPAIHIGAFPSMHGMFWSSSAFAGGGSGWLIDFESGGVTYCNNADLYSARCVR